MSFTVDVEGLEELERRWKETLAALDDDLLRDSLEAADIGVTAMQENHPYQDRTYFLSGSMHVTPAASPEGKQEAELAVEAPYASFVNDGTSRARAFPFMPRGEEDAERALQANAEASVAYACEKMNV